MTTLMKASHEWSTRAPDERFNSLLALKHKASEERNLMATRTLNSRDLHVALHDGDVVLNGKSGATANLTHYSFGALAGRAGAPPSYLRELSPRLVVECLNEGFAHMSDTAKSQLLFRKGQESALTLRGITSDEYTRIHNVDVIDRLLNLEATSSWRPAPEAFDGSRGLYMGDRDMFAFMVDNGRRIFEKDKNGGLSRGFFCWNSEVGARSFGIMTFFYEYVCGNHRVWGASGIKELRIRHVGTADVKAFGELQGRLVEYANGSATEDEAKIMRAKNFSLGSNKDEVIDRVFGMRLLTRDVIGKGYDLAVEREDWYGNPRSPWGLVGGLTEVARDLPNADERSNMERAASRVMEIAF